MKIVNPNKNKNLFITFIGILLIVLCLNANTFYASEVLSTSLSTSKLTSHKYTKNKIKINSVNGFQKYSKKKIFNRIEPIKVDTTPITDKIEKTSQNKLKNLTNSENIENVKVSEKDNILNDWLMISSGTFRNSAVFPEIHIGYMNPNIKIKFDNFDYRINDAHAKDLSDNENTPANNKLFWFRLTKNMIFYSSTKNDLNILGGNKIENIFNINILKQDFFGNFCFTIDDISGYDWKICTEIEKVRDKWLCALEKLKGKELENFCTDNYNNNNSNYSNKENIVYKNVRNLIYFTPLMIYNLIFE